MVEKNTSARYIEDHVDGSNGRKLISEQSLKRSPRGSCVMMKKSMDDAVLRKKIIVLLKDAGSTSSTRDLNDAVRNMLKILPPPPVKMIPAHPPRPCAHPPLPDFLAAGSWTRAESEYLVIDLSTWAVRPAGEAPNLSDEKCRTTELWLRRVPAGTFVMGGTYPEDIKIFSNELPAHKVTLTKDYYLGIFPVTQKQWELVMDTKVEYYREDESEHPAQQISYDDICGKDRRHPRSARVSPDSFLGKLRAKIGFEGLDLPTEAQWEYACRAGTTTEYSFGDSITPSQVNYRDSGIGTTVVGSYPPNAWGLYDMHGNVYEFCRDWFSAYAREEAIDPTGPSRYSPESEGAHVGRGGSYHATSGFCRSACRARLSINIDHDLGFRLALVPVR